MRTLINLLWLSVTTILSNLNFVERHRNEIARLRWEVEVERRRGDELERCCYVEQLRGDELAARNSKLIRETAYYEYALRYAQTAYVPWMVAGTLAGTKAQHMAVKEGVKQGVIP